MPDELPFVSLSEAGFVDLLEPEDVADGVLESVV